MLRFTIHASPITELAPQKKNKNNNSNKLKTLRYAYKKGDKFYISDQQNNMWSY